MASINRNKVNDAQKRRARRIEERLKEQNVGESHAEKVALHEAGRTHHGGKGGGANAGGEAKKKTDHAAARQRNGSRKRLSS